VSISVRYAIQVVIKKLHVLVHVVNEVQAPAVLGVDLVLAAELDDLAVHLCQL
jgi:hypothetical protein